ncbi:MAG: histidine phosphatase family protein [Devosiaceae bacterium]|nr:histidine phosphatase family protein [Devosiaceae bacterium MH13]
MPTATDPHERTIFLLRHAKSSWREPGLEDHERPLNTRGRKATASLAQFMADYALDSILCSPARRTRQTLEPILEAMRETPGPVYEPLLYESSPGTYLSCLQALAPEVRHVLLVGHSPSIESVCALLAGTADDGALSRLALKYPTGTLSQLTWHGSAWDALAPGCAHLAKVTRPRDLD